MTDPALKTARYYANSKLSGAYPSQATLWADATRLSTALLDATAEVERLRGVHLAATKQAWSFHRGTLRERIEWCRLQHQLAAENPPPHPPTREQKADFDRACVGWYDEMLRQLDALLGALRRIAEPSTKPWPQLADERRGIAVDALAAVSVGQQKEPRRCRALSDGSDRSYYNQCSYAEGHEGSHSFEQQKEPE